MSTFKQTILNDEPISFWTFDLDSQPLHNHNIIDEILNTNPLVSYGDNYRLEYQSLNDLETVNQYSIIFAENEKYNGDWSKAYLEAIHSSDYEFNDNNFTLEFLYYKDKPLTIDDAGEVGQYQTIISPLIIKENLIDLKISSNNVMSLKFLNNEFNINFTQNTKTILYEAMVHCIITYKVVQTDINEYDAILSLYLNGKLIEKVVNGYIDNTPILNVNSPWRIGANDGNNPVTDYQTEKLVIDQVAIYDKVLNDEMVSNHYKQLKRYNELILLDKPTQYTRFNDNNELLKVASATVGYDGKYHDNFTLNNPSTSKIIDSSSAFFNNGGTLSIVNQFLTPFLNISNDYTVEFWFKSASTDMGVLFKCIEEEPPWKGLTIWFNTNNNVKELGTIQINEDKNNHIVSDNTINYNDNMWHHLVVVRTGNNLDLIIDNIIQNSSVYLPLSTNTKPSQIHMMGSAPDNNSIDGFISELAIYNYALQPLQINHRFNYSTRFKTFGYTLLEGQGIQAKVRFYDTLTGELKGEVLSDINNGEFTFYTYSNRTLDILSLIPNSNTTNYRVHGMITPAEYTQI